MNASPVTDYRIVLEFNTGKALISKNVFAENEKAMVPDCLIKKNDAVSDSTIDIESEPKGKQNGTAPLQNNIVHKANKQKNSNNSKQNTILEFLRKLKYRNNPCEKSKTLNT